MGEASQHHAWAHLTKARCYQVHLDQDLFSDRTLVMVWGGIGSNRGRMHSTGVVSYEVGLKQVDEIARRRAQHGYAEVTRQRKLGSDGLRLLPDSRDRPKQSQILDDRCAKRQPEIF